MALAPQELCHWGTTRSARLLFSILFLGCLGVFFVYFDEKIIASAYLKALLTFKTFVSSTPSPLSMASVFKNIV